MTEWYLRKAEGVEYGPADIDALRQWAEDGRIAPEDALSQDREHWQPAPSVAPLEMVCEIILDDGNRYGPLNALALREMMVDHSISLSTPIRHVILDTLRPAGAWLLDALARREAVLVDKVETLNERNADFILRINTLSEQVASLENRLAATPITPPKAKAQQGTSTVIRGDPSFKDAQKWKVLYEAERTQRLESEDRLTTESKELRHQLHDTQSAKDRVAYRINQLEKQLEELQLALDGSGMSVATTSAIELDSYRNLSENYDTLLDQLREKSEELDTLREARDEAEDSANTRVRQIEERLHREREDAEKSRRRLSELENAHMQIVRSFRDLNERYIVLRQQTHPPPANAGSGIQMSQSAEKKQDTAHSR